jgi:hypothetical protein
MSAQIFKTILTTDETLIRKDKKMSVVVQRSKSDKFCRKEMAARPTCVPSGAHQEHDSLPIIETL